MDATKPRIPFIVGPTAIGKTALSLALAERQPSAIVSADSRQIYRRMDIGTAKPEPEVLNRVPHYLIDMLDPTEVFNAGAWGRQALTVINDLLAQDIQPIVVGGSGFYIRALVEGFFQEPGYDRSELEQIRSEFTVMRTSTLRRMLKQVDPESARRIMPNDRQRTIRALEIYEMTGQKLSELQAEHTSEKMLSFEPVYFGLEMPRDQLYERINQRVDDMIRTGLIEEVEMLLSDDYDPELNAFQTVGYREVFPYLQGRTGLYETIQQIKKNTRHYAKRQLTWFRHNDEINWLDAYTDPDELVSNIEFIMRKPQG